jgi:DNA polymerase-1
MHQADVLEDLAKEHEIVRLILQRRELQKLSSTFVENLIGFAVEDGSGIQQFTI